MIKDGWQPVDDRLILRHLAIQHAQRIGDSAPLAVFAQLFGDAGQFTAQALQNAGRQLNRPPNSPAA
jgi:hypothetical protein